MFNQYRRLKENMIKNQLIPNGIKNEAVLQAFWDIERHDFVSETFAARAYEDKPLPIEYGQTISQPLMVAIMTTSAQISPNLKVLEIGTGSGFQAAILAKLGAQVYTIERHMNLLNAARQRFDKYQLRIQSMCGDGTLGWPDKSPFDRILVTAAGPEIPHSLLNQLAENGFILIPVGNKDEQILKKVERKANKFIEENLSRCKFVPLIGKEGWED